MTVGRGIKIALDGYNAYTDKDPNHFSLYVDQNEDDYILIKEKTRNQVSVNGTVNVSHGLNYVPFCLVFVEISSGVWRKVHSVPIDSVGYWYEVNDSNLVLKNTTGSAKNFAYQIFYDNVTEGDAPDLVYPSNHRIFAIAKKGKNVFSLNPNDFIFHSDLNTFKIVLEHTIAGTIDANSTQPIEFVWEEQGHPMRFIPLVSAFAKQDGINQVLLPNAVNIDIWGAKVGWVSTGLRFNFISSSLYSAVFNFTNTTGSNINVTVKFFVLEAIK